MDDADRYYALLHGYPIQAVQREDARTRDGKYIVRGNTIDARGRDTAWLGPNAPQRPLRHRAYFDGWGTGVCGYGTTHAEAVDALLAESGRTRDQIVDADRFRQEFASWSECAGTGDASTLARPDLAEYAHHDEFNASRYYHADLALWEKARPNGRADAPAVAAG